MKFLFSTICTLLFLQVSIAQNQAFKIDYKLSVSDEILAELENTDLSDSTSDLALMQEFLDQSTAGKSIFVAWVNKEGYKVISSNDPDNAIIINNNDKIAAIVNAVDSTYSHIDKLAFIKNEGDEDTDATIEYDPTQTKEIAGYTCKLATISYIDPTSEEGGFELEVWYTEKIPAFVWGNYFVLKDLPGAALKITVHGVSFEASKVANESVKSDFFSIPKDFTEDTYSADDAPDEMDLGEGIIAYYDSTSTSYGLKNENGEQITDAIFANVSGFHDGVAIAFNADYKAGLIDKSGESIVPFEYESIEFDEELGNYIYSKDNKFSVMDKGGKQVWNESYEFLGHFVNKKAVISKTEKFGIVDLSGNVIVPAEYESIVDFDDSYYIVIAGEDFKIFDINTKKLILEGYKGLNLSNLPNLFIASKDGVTYGYVNEKNETVIPFEYSVASPFYDGVAPVVKAGTEDYIYINPKGEVVTQDQE